VGREFDDEFAEFVTRWSPALLRVAFLLTSDRGEAEDLLQTALLKTSRHWSSCPRGCAPSWSSGHPDRRADPGVGLPVGAHDPLDRGDAVGDPGRALLIAAGAVGPDGIEVHKINWTQLFSFVDGAWAPVDRSASCAAGQVPADIEHIPCETD
jgi:hypothetical protein